MKCLLFCVLVASALAVPISQVDEDFPEENEGLFEGDIELLPGDNPHDRNAARNSHYKWPHGVIPYIIDTSHFTGSSLAVIKRAIQTLEDQTAVNGKKCLSFVPRTTESVYVKYQGGSGCHTPVGRHYGKSGITLGRGCLRIGTIMHETMHALGFWHEQSRPDRDSYVTIEWNNIQKGHEHNFDKYSTSMVDTQGINYDYESVMHYSAYSFAIDRRKPTIIPKRSGVVIGQRTHLSPSDILEIQKYYGCGTGGSSHVSTHSPLHTTHGPAQLGELCTFESGLCHWTNVGGDQTNWVRHRGSTPSIGTGPANDHTTLSKSGYYLYVEASGHTRQTARLNSDLHSPGYYCLDMYYSMYGHDMGALKIYALLGSHRQLIHTFSGDHGNYWRHYRLNLHVTNGNFMIELEGDVGRSYRSDIAIDDVTLHSGKC
ncbi:astacin-like [Gigantopelta aegis]|uniref:astacin-like n=1 Tax=Gigantopelta aegis TaxID=1735272 RepID=UPI001B889170|nr:astacin-like [Gigantopelta aegis]